MTQRIGLIGYPLGHSISPVFQQAALDHLKIDACYELWETTPQQLESVVDSVHSPEIIGANVTVPYKEDVISMLDDLDDLAQSIGAVNTIVKKGDQLVGYNTDAGGFLRALKEQGSFDPAGKQAVIIGAGGVARAISFVLLKAGTKSISLYDIELQRCRKLAQDLASTSVKIIEGVDTPEYAESITAADLLINCTPIGMKHSPTENRSPVPQNLISSDSLVYDVVYNPLKTKLLEEAEAAGARTLGGLSMLVYQGIEAFELWTGRDAPIDIMMQKAQNAL